MLNLRRGQGESLLIRLLRRLRRRLLRRLFISLFIVYIIKIYIKSYLKYSLRSSLSKGSTTGEAPLLFLPQPSLDLFLPFHYWNFFEDSASFHFFIYTFMIRNLVIFYKILYSPLCRKKQRGPFCITAW